MQGASPLASPGLDGARHGLNLWSRHPAGAYPRRWWLDQPLRCLTEACPAGCLPTLPLVYFVSPIPPPFPSGEGRDQGYFMQGASPLASPGLGGARHGLNLRSRRPAGAYPRRWRLDQPLRCPAGGLPGGVPAYPAVSLLCFPHPPAPLPLRGWGRFLVISPGAPPPAPRHLPAYGTYRPCRTGILRKGACGSAQWQRNQLPKECAARVQFWGCKGRSPLHEKTLGSPLPAGKGGRGDGGRIKAKGRVGKRQAKQSPARVPVRQVGRRQRSKCRRREIYASGCCKKAPDVVY